MDNKTKAEFFEKLNSSSPIDTILMMYPDLVQNFAGYFESHKAIFESKLRDRIGKEEKLQFLKEEILKHRATIEKDIVSNVYNLFTQPKAQFLENSVKFVGSLPDMIPFIPKEYEQLHSPEFLASLTKLTSLDSDISLEDLGVFVKQLPLNDFESPALLDAFNSPDPSKATFTVLIFIHFEKQYIQYLLALYEEIESGKSPSQLLSDVNTEKMEWLGTQKQLAELFVELEKKGWIKEKNADLIEAYFTNSNTIKQVLKPTQDPKTKEKLYEGIYTTKYKPVFDQIKPNKPSQQ